MQVVRKWSDSGHILKVKTLNVGYEGIRGVKKGCKDFGLSY